MGKDDSSLTGGLFPVPFFVNLIQFSTDRLQEGEFSFVEKKGNILFQGNGDKSTSIFILHTMICAKLKSLVKHQFSANIVQGKCKIFAVQYGK